MEVHVLLLSCLYGSVADRSSAFPSQSPLYLAEKYLRNAKYTILMSLAHFRQVSPGLTNSTNFNIRNSSNGAAEHRRVGCPTTQASKVAIHGRLGYTSESHSKSTRSLSPTRSPPSAKGRSASHTPQRGVTNIQNSDLLSPANNGNTNLFPTNYANGNTNLRIPGDGGTHNSGIDIGMAV